MSKQNDPRESDEMSLMETVYVEACSNTSHYGSKNDGVHEGAPDDDDDE